MREDPALIDACNAAPLGAASARPEREEVIQPTVCDDAPFVIFALPRSRTAWLSKFLTVGDWVCGHDEIRHCRSLDDAKAWFAQPCVGTIETAAAPFWRLTAKIAPRARIVVIRRPVEEVVASMLAIPGMVFDEECLTAAMRALDHKLDQIEARLPCLSVKYADLAHEKTCKAVFEYCLPYRHDPERWAAWDAMNVQIDMRALSRYCHAYGPALDKLAAQAKQRVLSDFAMRRPIEPDGITIQAESFADWVRDAEPLFNEHLSRVGEAPGDWQRKNLGLMSNLYDLGAMQIATARCNGRMFGYLMTVVSPSLTSPDVVTGTHTTFFADEHFPGLGLKLQRAALRMLRERGVTEVFWEAGQRGDGPRLGTMYRRLGGVAHSQTYRLELEAA